MVGRLALGTAQFGLAYGVANTSGRLAMDEAARILTEARASGIDTVDTAAAYGDSEAVLGAIGVNGLRLVTKLPALANDVPDVSGWVDKAIRESLRRLRTPQVDIILLHHPADLMGPHGAELYRALASARSTGLMKRIGISIYNPEELDLLWDHYDFDAVQAPFNVFDRRLAESGWLERLADNGTEVHTRSAFLQGVLLMPAAKRPASFARWGALFARWDAWLQENAQSALHACLAFVLAHHAVSRVVVGVDSLQHLQQIIGAARGSAMSPPAELSSHDLQLVNPGQWVLT